MKCSNSLFNDRLDPHFYDPNISYIKSRINNLPGKSLGEIADVWMPNRFARSRADKGHGIPFYSSANMMRARCIRRSKSDPSRRSDFDYAR